jgi:hypothetical protein
VPQMKASFPTDDAELRIELDVATAAPGGPDGNAEVTRRVVTRRIHVEGGATIVVALGADLER